MGVTTIQRRHALRAMLDGEGRLGDLARSEHFESEDDVLLEAHQEWVRLLSGRLHRGQVVARRTALTVRDVYDELCAEHAGLRAILDAERANPVLWEPVAREHALLARVAGLADDTESWEQAATVGRALVMQRIPVQRGALA